MIKKSSTSKAPYSKFARFLHIFMLILSLLASTALYIVDSFTYKIIFTILLISYALFLIINTHAIQLIFKISGGQNRNQYLKVHQWKAEEPTQTGSILQNNSKFAQSQSKKNSDHTLKQVSLDSADRSVLKDESYSSFRGMSTSHINDSHISNNKKSKMLESRGYDILDLSFLNDKSETKSLGKSSIASDKTFQILDRKSIARKKIHSYKSQSQIIYEEQLAQINKSGKYVQSRYKKILNTIHNIVNPIINEHRTNTLKIQEATSEYLEVIIDQKSTQINSQQQYRNQKSNQPMKISLQGLIEKFIDAYAKSIPIQQTKLPLKKNKKWNDFEKKMNELLRNRIRIAENLGVNTQYLGSKVQRASIQFVGHYNNYISMMQSYITSDLHNKKNLEASLEELSDQNLLKDFKSKIYILYLYIKHLNQLLKGSIKIDLKDYLGFKQLNSGEADFQISPKYSFDAYVPYFNLFVLEKRQKKKCYPCQYGTTNYLSLIYFLLFSIAKNTDAIRDKSDVLKIINETL